VPLPVNAMLSVGFPGSLLVITILPVEDPAAVGVKVNVTDALCPVAIVFGVVIPLSVNSAPVNCSSEMVRSDPPAFVIVKFFVPEVPTLTVPKFTDELLGEICAVGVTAFAVRFNTIGVVAASSTTDNVPFTLPVAAGFTETEKLVACPGGSESGSMAEDSVNSGFDTMTCVMVTVAVPGLPTETVCVDCFPIATFPKLRAVGFSLRAPGCVLPPPGLLIRPVHPFSARRTTSRLGILSHVWTGDLFVRTRSLTRWTPPAPAASMANPPLMSVARVKVLVLSFLLVG
jgi:hypothetical protein